MKCLLLHCKSFAYKLDHPITAMEGIKKKEQASYKNALVAFVAVEKQDTPALIDKATQEIAQIASKVKASGIIINPFAHLSSNLGSASQAKEITQLLFDELKKQFEGEVVYTSFGWYKSFMLDVHGHANSQIFREF